MFLLSGQQKKEILFQDLFTNNKSIKDDLPPENWSRI